MLDLQVETKSQFSLFPWGHSTSVNISLKLAGSSEKLPLAKIAEEFFRVAPEIESFSVNTPGDDNPDNGKRLVNVRGRPHETFNPAPAYLRKSGAEELFYADGNLLIPPDDSEDNGDDAEIGPERTPFEFRILSKFASFDHKQRIIHDVISSTAGKAHVLKQELTPSRVCRLSPAELKNVRLAFELYKERFFGSLLGSSPIVECRFYLELSQNEIKVFAWKSASKEGKFFCSEHLKMLNALDGSLTKTKTFPELTKALELQLG